MTDEDLERIRARAANLADVRSVGPADFRDLMSQHVRSIAMAYYEDVPALLTEVERLRVEEANMQKKWVIVRISDRLIGGTGEEEVVAVAYSQEVARLLTKYVNSRVEPPEAYGYRAATSAR